MIYEPIARLIVCAHSFHLSNVITCVVRMLLSTTMSDREPARRMPGPPCTSIILPVRFNPTPPGAGVASKASPFSRSVSCIDARTSPCGSAP